MITVLIADDQPPQRLGFRMLLESNPDTAVAGPVNRVRPEPGAVRGAAVLVERLPAGSGPHPSGG